MIIKALKIFVNAKVTNTEKQKATVKFLSLFSFFFKKSAATLSFAEDSVVSPFRGESGCKTFQARFDSKDLAPGLISTRDVKGGRVFKYKQTCLITIKFYCCICS